MTRKIVQSNESHNIQPDPRSALLEKVVLEGIRQSRQTADQAHWSFIVATLITTASSCFGLGGAGLLLMEMTSEATLTTAIGIVSGVCSYQLSKEAADRQKQANERLDQMLQELQENDKQEKQ